MKEKTAIKCGFAGVTAVMPCTLRRDFLKTAGYCGIASATAGIQSLCLPVSWSRLPEQQAGVIPQEELQSETVRILHKLKPEKTHKKIPV